MKRVIPLVLSLALLVVGIIYLTRTEKEESGKVRELYATVEPLERERTALQEELDNLNGSYGLKMRDYGTVEILFPELNTQIISQAYPIMRDHNVVGVLGFSPSQMPGSYNQLSLEDTKRLISEGWGSCFIYENPWGDFVGWYNYICNYLKSYGLPIPTSIYFKNNDYDPALTEALIACGISTVVQNASNGRTDTVSDPAGPIWYTGAMPWNYTGFSTDVELLGRTNGSNLCFVLRFTSAWDPELKAWNDNGTGEQEKEAFQATLDSWKSMIYAESPLDEMEKLGVSSYFGDESDEAMAEARRQLYYDSLSAEQQLLLPRFRLVTLDEARSCHLEAAQADSDMARELEEKQTELETRLAELDEKIRSTYDEFNAG